MNNHNFQHEEFSLDGPPPNPFYPLTYDDAMELAELEDLDDDDYDVINSAFTLFEDPPD
ncbi:hypothetical protein [Cyanobium sp. ATX 6F1]|uniref:hypothetical protein n=1 Tax=unclassified Cyanobium TaxID=2627006 RepID=UPI0020CCE6C1|nr:hypothetical protein [Cyanobium sp. ATX 6F1]MCP9916930.1 hypothetical protein [Cyanobium sp. ATX 6F1]